MTHDLPTTPPNNDFASIFMYQRCRGALARSSLQWVYSPNSTLMHIGLFDPHGSGPGATAARELARSVWIDFASTDPQLRNEKEWLPKFIEELNSELWIIGHGSIKGDFCGLVFEKSTQSVRVYLSGYPSPQIRNHDENQFQRLTSASGLALGSRETSMFTQVRTELSPRSEIIVHSREITHRSLIKPLAELRNVPYPKAGAAELLYFAWLKQNKDRRKKTEKNAQILWIAGENAHTPR